MGWRQLERQRLAVVRSCDRAIAESHRELDQIARDRAELRRLAEREGNAFAKYANACAVRLNEMEAYTWA